MLHVLDTRTLMTVVWVVAAVLLVAQLLQWRIHRAVPGTGCWALMTTGFCSGVALLAVRGVAPAFVSIVVANVILVLSGLSGLEGMRRFRGRRASRRERHVAVALVVAALAGQSYFTYVLPSLRARVVLMSALLGTALGATVWELARIQLPRMRAISRSTAALFAVVVLVLGFRGFYYLFYGSTDRSFLESSIWQSGTFLATLVAAIGWTVGLLLLAAQRVELELHDAKERLEKLAATDPLTGIKNRRALLEEADLELRRAARQHGPISVIMVDLDHFKEVNDRHGHEAGDQVLKEVVARCAAELREYDLFGRLGGEEFAIAAPSTGHRGAMEMAERLRGMISVAPVSTSAGPLRVTASFGVVTLEEGEATVASLLRSADESLYAAKRSGRNRVVGRPIFAAGSTPPPIAGEAMAVGRPAIEAVQPRLLSEPPLLPRAVSGAGSGGICRGAAE